MRFTSRARVLAALGASTAAVLAISGCSPSELAAEDADEITAIFLSSNAYDPCSTEYAEKFTEETGIKVNLIHEGYPTYHDKLLTTFSGGSDTYDVAMIVYQWVGEFAGAGFLEPLDERLSADSDELDDIIPSANELYVHEDEQYAIPFTAQAETLFYRTDLFEQAGFEPPATWDEYQDIAKFFTNNPDYPGVTGTSVKAASQHTQTGFENRYFGLGGEPLGAPGSELDVDIATEALQFMKDAAVDYSPAGSLSATFVEQGAQLQAGSVAMVEMMPSTVLPLVTADDPANLVKGKIGLADIPGGHSEAGGWGLAVPTSSQKKDAAYDFAKFMVSAEADLGCYADYGKSAVRSGTYEDAEIADTFYAAGVLSALEGSYGAPKDVTAPKIGTMQADIISRFLAGQIGSAAEAAQEMADQYEQIVNAG
jgi:multiple sugar transport system substrate-binding protein